MYYIFVEDNKLNGAGQARCLNEEVLNVEVSEELYNSYCKNPLKYIFQEGGIVENPDFEQIQVQKEREELDKLSLTRADVERAIYKAKGIDFEDILELVKDNSEIDLKALKIELKANNFYRGNPYINKIGEILGFNQEQLDNFFKTNNPEELMLD